MVMNRIGGRLRPGLVAALLVASLGLQGCKNEAEVSGHVLDDAVFNARVEISDVSGGKSLGHRETHRDGSYSFSRIPKEDAYLVKSSGGRINGQAFVGSLSAICTEGEGCDLTPLTTLAVMAAGSGGLDAYHSAQESQRTVLGLTADDPFVADNAGQVQTSVDLVKLRARIGDGSTLEALLNEILADIADGNLDSDELRGYFPNAPTKADRLIQRAEAIMRGDPSVPLTPEADLQNVLAPLLTTEAKTRTTRLQHNHDLVLHAVDPEPAWIGTRASSSMLIVGPGEEHSVDLVKLDSAGNVIGPVDTAKLRVELRIQRNENTIDYIPAEFQGDYVAWDAAVAGRLNIHVPADLNRGRLLIGVRPNFTDAGQTAIAERWSVPILVDVWPLQPNVTPLTEDAVYYPLGTDAHFRDGSAFDTVAVTGALQQAGLDPALAGQPLKALVVKDMALQEGQLVDYRLPDAKGGIYPYGGRVVKVIEGVDGQQLALLDFDVFSVYDVLLGDNNLLAKEGVLPEFVTYREGDALPADGSAGDAPGYFGPPDRATIQSASGSSRATIQSASGLIETECSAGAPPTLTWTPFFDVNFDTGIKAGIGYSYGIQGVNLDCTFKATGVEYTVPFGGPIGLLIEKITGTGVKVGPYGEMKIGLSSGGTGFTNLTIAGEVSTEGASPPHVDWNGSLGTGLDASPIVVKPSVGGELGMQAKISAVDVSLPFIGSYKVSYENKIGWVGSLFGEGANAAAVKGGTSSSLGTEFGLKFTGTASPDLKGLLKKLGAKLLDPDLEMAFTSTARITADYNLGDVYDDGQGNAFAVIQPANDKIRMLTSGNGSSDGYASLENSSVYNDLNSSISYELSECDSHGGRIETPLIGCMNGFFCGNVNANAKLCGGQVYVTPVFGSGNEGDTVTSSATVGVKQSASPNAEPLDISLSGSPLVPGKSSFQLTPGQSEDFSATATCSSRGVYTGNILASAGAGNQDSQQDLLTCKCKPDSKDCDRTWGDPYLLTADGLAYDYIASGDYILQEVVNDSGEPIPGLQVQARFLPGFDVSWPYSAALQVGNDVVEISPAILGHGMFSIGMEVQINGQYVYPKASGGTGGSWAPLLQQRMIRLPGGGLIFIESFVQQYFTYKPRVMTVVWPSDGPFAGYGLQLSMPDGQSANPQPFLSLQFIRPTAHSGHERGMMGNNDGDPTNDFMRRNGEVLGQDTAMSWTALYGLFGGDWLVRPQECLFSDGCTTRPDFPTTAVVLTPDQRALGEAACAALVGFYKEACIHDVGLSGMVDLVREYYANTNDLNWMASKLQTPSTQLAVYTLTRGARESLPEQNVAYRQGLSVGHVQGEGKFLLSLRPPRGASAAFTAGQPGALGSNFVAEGDLATAVDVHCGQPDPDWAALGDAWAKVGAIQLWALDPLSGFATQMLDEIPLNCFSGQNMHLVAGGVNHTLAQDDAGNLWAWGYNGQGQLGDGTTTSHSTPVAVVAPVGGAHAISVVAGEQHSLAMTDTGDLLAWGYNGHGELGDGTTQNRSEPVKVNLDALGGAQIVSVQAGASFNVILDDAGKIWTWGSNSSGMLGDGTTTDRTTPVAANLAALGSSKVVSVATGGYHTLALDDTGRLWAWGQNISGALGDGTTVVKTSPIEVDMSGFGAARAVAVAASYRQSFALDDAGRLWAWGYNSYGQLGDGTTTNRTRPVAVDLSALGNASVVSVAGGLMHTLILDDAGRVWALGGNANGQLGDGTTTGRLTPVAVDLSALGGTEVVAVEAGRYHSLAVDAKHRLWAWGANNVGQLGDGTSVQRTTPVLVGALSGAIDVSDSGLPNTLTLAVGHDMLLGTLHMTSGRLGAAMVRIQNAGFSLGAAGQSSAVVPVGESSQRLFVRCDTPGVRQVMGYELTDDNGNVLISGQVDATCTADIRKSVIPVNGGLTLAFTNSGAQDAWIRFTPTAGIALSGMTEWEGSLAQQGVQSLSLTGIECPFSGAQELGVLSFLDGSGQVYAQQTVMAPATSCGTQLGLGRYHSMALDSAGHLWAWGSNGYEGRLGVGSYSDVYSSARPIAVNLKALGGVAVKSVSSGKGDHTLALDESGQVWAWGSNGQGQLGDGTTTTRFLPVAVDLGVLNGAKVESVVAGYAHSLALDGEGRLWAWGGNAYGQLGDGTTNNRLTPVTVDLGYLGGAGVTFVAADNDASFIMDEDGRVWAWGRNFGGQLGNGTTTDSTMPIAVDLTALGGARVVSLAAGNHNVLVVDDQGRLWGWGSNGNGELGDGTTTTRLTPVAADLSALGGAKVVSVAAGSNFTLALDDTGKIWSWGNSYNSVLGRATTSSCVGSACPEPAAVDMSPLGGAAVVAIGAGEFHSLALDETGRLWAWGYNYSGVLGDGTGQQSNVPVLVGMLNGATQVVASDVPASASLPANRDVALGLLRVKSGRLGDSTIQVQGAAFSLGAAGQNSVVTPAGEKAHALFARCDTPGSRQLLDYQIVESDGTSVYSGQVDITCEADISQAVHFDNTGAMSLTLTNAGNPDAWVRFTPASGVTLSGMTIWEGNLVQQGEQVLSLTGISCPFHGKQKLGVLEFLDALGQVYAQRPVDAWEMMCGSPRAMGGAHSLALDEASGLWAWGYNSSYQLGDGTNTNRMFPVTVDLTPLSVANVVSVAAGMDYSLALDDAGGLWSWGSNGNKQLGDGSVSQRGTPGAVDLAALNGAKVVSVVAGQYHVLALDDNGQLWGWGSNYYGKLGDGTNTDRPTPVAVDLSSLGGAKVVAMAAGLGTSFAVDENGRLWGWGSNVWGEMGDGSSSDSEHFRPGPVDVIALSGAKVVSVGAGFGHVVILDDQGRLWAWGYNYYGQLGDGTDTNRSMPAAVDLSALGGAKVVSVASGAEYVVALDENGKLWAWGDNYQGQLGDGTTALHSAPVPVDMTPLNGAKFVSISPSYDHMLALDDAGRLWAWGSNAYGQIGVGSTTDSYVPVQVDVSTLNGTPWAP